MAKDFSAFLGPKKKKNLNLTGPNPQKKQSEDKTSRPLDSKAGSNLVHEDNVQTTEVNKTSSKVIGNAEQTNIKQVPNGPQTDFKQIPKKRETGTTRGIKQVPNGPQTDFKQIPKKRETGTTRGIKQIPNGPQTGTTRDTTNIDLDVLVGKEKAFVDLVFSECKRSGSLETPKMTLEFIRNHLEVSPTRAKGIIYRLTQKGIIFRSSSKTGRGGWVKFGIQENAYRELSYKENSLKQIPNRYQTDCKEAPKGIPQGIPEAPSSSSYSNIKSTSTNDELWKTLNLSLVEKMGINESAIFEARQKFGPFDFVEFEGFLERFSKYMADSKKSRSISNARGFFFSLCKQIGEGIEPLSEIETDQDIALKELLVEKRRAKKEREDLQRELMEFEFEEWFEGLSNDEKVKLAPKNDLVKEGSAPYKAVFRGYFEENLWDKETQLVIKG
jgi:hypothetical protein